MGHYRRAIAIGMQVMFANAGGAIASNIYRVQDAPRYLLGRECPNNLWLYCSAEYVTVTMLGLQMPSSSGLSAWA